MSCSRFFCPNMKFFALDTNFINSIKNKGLKSYKKLTDVLKRRPMGSFLTVLGMLLVIMILGKVLQQTKVESVKELSVKSVSVFSIGDSPKATFQAKIEKSGVIKLIAQAPGVVQGINVTEGDAVYKGQQIVSLSSNYQGGNAGSVQRQIAQTQYQNVLDTYDTQKDLIQKQKDTATTSDDNAGKLRDISRKSIDETNSLINANQAALDQLRQNPNPSLVEQQTINQLQGGINQLREAVRGIDYSSSNDNPPAKLSSMQKDIALKQLDIQQKGLYASKEISGLQLSLAYISEATMYPASPFSGKVERVYVHIGQLVSPGTVIATITSTDVKATAVLTVPAKVAGVLSQGLPSEIKMNDKKIALTPYYVSSQATDGQLFSAFYDIPDAYQNDFSDGDYIDINVPINSVKTTATDPLVPIDAVYQTQDQAFVLVAENKKAVTKTVKIGQIYGSYIEVLTGLSSGDQIILDRNVIAGDSIKVY
ncbi:biotin/lipoyl-binding protein [Candidatus Roizmanbacteria bacterium]|nr:biotin/lipoyl-binding protein [Candidatus Roizmanbacteria bacterium]